METLTKQQFAQLKEIFERNTGLKIENFFDKDFLKLGICTFDINAFDNYARENLGYSEEKHGSLKDFVLKKYPKEVSDIIVYLFEFYIFK